MYGQILCFCLHAYEGCESKPKDSVYNNYASQFLEVFQQEKSAHYTGVNTVHNCLLMPATWVSYSSDVY